MEVADYKPLKFDIKSVHMVVPWKFNLSSQECGLCRKDLAAPPPQDLLISDSSKVPKTSKDNLVLGACGHAFHKTCIDASIENKSSLCPVDGTQWQTSRILLNGAPWGTVAPNVPAGSVNAPDDAPKKVMKKTSKA